MGAPGPQGKDDKSTWGHDVEEVCRSERPLRKVWCLYLLSSPHKATKNGKGALESLGRR